MSDLFWILLAGIVSAMPALLTKAYITTKNGVYIVLAVIAAVFLVYTYIKVFSNHAVGTYYVILKVLAIITVFIVATFIFKEKFKPIYILGLIFAILAIILLSR